ncbi:penicillin-binding transpeptidase domain-containing protein [Chryseobacterium vrystaatense]|nr:penicillin-binding transpeptidase domain-containing protein [Chryseobacterium vrystaatense]
MLLKNLFFGMVSIISLVSCASTDMKHSSGTTQLRDPVIVRHDFKKYFDDCHTNGSIAIYDNQKNEWILSDPVETGKQSLPASTFKVINLLIALETKTIASENDIVRWPGKTDTIQYGYRPDIYRDLSVKEAFELSAGWVFVELAKKIGKENYKKFLTKSGYGNLDLSETDPDFWNFGHFAISPIEQVEFLRNFYKGRLPFSKRNIDIVKKVMITENNSDYTIHSKTGWTRDSGINTGWWVGYLESQHGTYFFATLLLQDRKVNTPNFGNCRKEITKSVLKNLGVTK